jgi:hypothetical protein
MTMPLEETYVSIDADLDTADDKSRHAHCTFCQGRKPGPVVALCGEIKITTGAVEPGGAVPADACGTCVDLFYMPCVLCGMGPYGD